MPAYATKKGCHVPDSKKATIKRAKLVREVPRARKAPDDRSEADAVKLSEWQDPLTGLTPEQRLKERHGLD